MEQSTLFGRTITRKYPWSTIYTTDGYLDLLRTHSDHRMLSAEVFRRVEQGVAHLIDDIGGALRVDYVTTLHIARRADSD